MNVSRQSGFRLPHRRLHHGIGQVEPDGLDPFEQRLEGITEGHEFIGLGDDVLLFGERAKEA